MNIQFRNLKKGAVAAVALAGLAFGASAISATSAEAGWRHRHGGAIAAGVIGGLALGAIAANAYGRPAYYHRPVYYGYGGCYWTRVRERVSWDTVVIRRVRVCN